MTMSVNAIYYLSLINPYKGEGTGGPIAPNISDDGPKEVPYFTTGPGCVSKLNFTVPF